MRPHARRWVAASGLALVATMAAACGSGSSGGSLATSSSPKPGTLNANGCTTPPALQQNHLKFAHEPPLKIARTTYTARIVTNCGTIIVKLFGAKAPQTVNSFAFLAGRGYFNDTPCHRLTTQGIYVLQCGDPTGTGTGGPGYTLPEENLRGATYPAGTVAMARTQAPHSGGSQFFLVYQDSTSGLQPLYTPFGRVTAGLSILQRIAKAGSDNSNGPGDGHPNQPVVIESFAVTKG